MCVSVCVCVCVSARGCACSHLVKTGSLIRVCVFCWTCLGASSQILLQSEPPALPGEPLSDQIISGSLGERERGRKRRKKSCFIYWKTLHPYHLIFTWILHSSPVLNRYRTLLLVSPVFFLMRGELRFCICSILWLLFDSISQTKHPSWLPSG